MFEGGLRLVREKATFPLW